MEKEIEKKASKFMSFILRHNPQEIGLVLDSQGWVSIEEFINKANNYENNYVVFNKDIILEVVKNSDKQRFAIDESGEKIRANQGHSLNIDLGLDFVAPPQVLYHGTATKNIESIMKEGLKPMKRHDVHLSFNTSIARNVGMRYGKPIIFEVDAFQMDKDGFKFKCYKNNVWLTEFVPAKYLKIINV